MRLTRSKSLLAAALVLGVGPFPQPATAADEQARIGIVTPYVLLEPSGDFYTGFLAFSVAEGVESELTLELLDVWSTDEGERITLPAGSTPSSGKDRLTWSMSSTRYLPKVDSQIFRVELSIPTELLQRAPLSAAIRLTVSPAVAPSQPAAVGLVASAIAFAFASHPDSSHGNGGFEADIQNSNFMISDLADRDNPSRRARMFVEDQLVLASFETSNEGSLFAFVSHELTIRKTGFWVDPLSEEAVAYQTKIEQSIITPGQSRTREIPLTAQLVGTDRVVSRVADWGIYELILKTSHHSGQPDAVDQFESITVVVFPFRQLILLIIVIALAVVLALGARARHSLRKASLAGATSDGSTTAP
jgi:hypothetical protein